MAVKDLPVSHQGRLAAGRRLPAVSSGNPIALSVVWLVLVAVAVAGRLWQPAHHVTPMAAVGLAAGAVFASPLVAASVPVAALAASNLFLPPYGSFVMAIVVFAATAWPALLGRFVPGIRDGRAWSWVGGAFAHSLVFFVSTNLAYWLMSNDYPRSAAGLVECFTMALPFYRWMPVGDAAWSLAALGVLSAMAASSEWRSARMESVRMEVGADGRPGF